MGSFAMERFCAYRDGGCRCGAEDMVICGYFAAWIAWRARGRRNNNGLYRLRGRSGMRLLSRMGRVYLRGYLYDTVVAILSDV
jgi:hypothetical protein